MLTQRQRRFVEEYAAGRNGTQAAILAGYSAHTARAIACENLKKLEIADAIERLSAALTRNAQARQDQALTNLKNIAFEDIRDVLNPDGTVKDPAEWPEAARDVFRLVRRRQLVRGRRTGEYKLEVIGTKVKDRLRALDQLGKYLGMFPTKGRKS